MDAVQQANSGHPGTPMALAPVAYTLWQRFLRYDPADPIWPNRDRFVLSGGHASMLLYSLLHLAGVKAVNASTRRSASRRSRSTTSSSSASSAAAARAIPSTADHRRRDDHRPARPGRRQPASAWRSPAALAGRALQPAGLRRCSTTTSTRICGDGDMMEGDLERGGVARRPPEARQPVLDLRQQPDHDRGHDRPGVHRGRGDALRGLRLERARASATPTICEALAPRARARSRPPPTGRR